MVGAALWDRQHPTVGRPAAFKRRPETAFSAGLSASVALAVDMPPMPWIEKRSASFWAVGDFLLAGISAGMHAALTVGLASALVVSALAALVPRTATPARGLVAGLAPSIPATAALLQSLLWCGNVIVEQRAFGVTILSTAGIVAGTIACAFAARTADHG